MLKLPQQDYIKYLYENEELSINEISKVLGVNWRTAKKYALKDNWNTSVKIPSSRRQEGKVMTSEIQTIIDTILEEDLMVPRKQKHTAKLIYKRLCAEHNFLGSYRSVCLYVKSAKERMQNERKTIAETFERLEHTGGEAQIDFCTLQVYKDEILQNYKLLVMSFPYSNRAFVQPMPSENQECFLEGLKMLFEKCGAVPRRLWFDNLSAAVISHHPSKEHAHRTLTDAFIRFRSHYRFDAVFCNARKGNEKGNVENKCGYSRRNWCVPIPIFKDFESFTKQLDNQALEDAKRPHYYKKQTIEELFTEEKKHFLELPQIPYEIFKLDGAILNKYSEIAIDGKLFKVFNGVALQNVITKTYWNRIEILTQNHKGIETIYRPYTFKPQEVKWLDVFRNYSIKPRSYQYSQFKRMLPKIVQNFLNQEQSLQKERLKAIYHWLSHYSMKEIEEVLKNSSGNETIFVLTQRLSILKGEQPTSIITEDPYTPKNLQNTKQDLSVYDILTSSKGGSRLCL